MKLDLERVRKNVSSATTEDLLDRATVYRDGMEPDALAIIDADLAARGVTAEQVAAHLKSRRQTITRIDGSAIQCSHCRKPAIAQGWGWRFLVVIPLYPRRFRWCREHLPAGKHAILADDAETASSK